MRFPYLHAAVKDSIPSLGGSFSRPRPIVAVRAIGPRGSQLIDGLLDTGSDETVFEEWVAALIGVDLTQATHREIGLVGRVHPVRISHVDVRLRITDGSQEMYEWPAVVGFTSTRLRFPLLGYAGFMQFFDAQFCGNDCSVSLTPHSAFPGTVGPPQTKP